MEEVITLAPELFIQKQMDNKSSRSMQKILQNHVQDMKEAQIKKTIDNFSEEVLYEILWKSAKSLKNVKEELLEWMNQEEQKTGKIFVEVYKKCAEKMSKTLQKEYEECLGTELSLSKHLTHLIDCARLLPQEAICNNKMTSRIKRAQEKIGHFAQSQIEKLKEDVKQEIIAIPGKVYDKIKPSSWFKWSAETLDEADYNAYVPNDIDEFAW